MRQPEAPRRSFSTSSSTNDPEPVDNVDSTPEESSNSEEPPEPGDIDRESR